MGFNDGEFEGLVAAVLHAQSAQIVQAATVRPSRDGRYISVTVTVLAESRQQLEEIYQALRRHEQVLMLL